MWPTIRAILIVVSLAGSFCCWCCMKIGAEYECTEKQYRKYSEQKQRRNEDSLQEKPDVQ